MKFATSYF